LYGPCDVDVCNGKVFYLSDVDKVIATAHYGYVATMFFPYIVGCWGPGNEAKYIQATCTTNARLCSESIWMSGFQPLLLAAVILSFMFA
jgi:hypothetical protein